MARFIETDGGKAAFNVDLAESAGQQGDGRWFYYNRKNECLGAGPQPRYGTVVPNTDPAIAVVVFWAEGHRRLKIIAWQVEDDHMSLVPICIEPVEEFAEWCIESRFHDGADYLFECDRSFPTFDEAYEYAMNNIAIAAAEARKK